MMKRLSHALFSAGLFFLILGFLLSNHETIYFFVEKYVLQNQIDKSIGIGNDYTRDYDFLYIQNTTQYTPYSYQDILNIIYTGLNHGKEQFYFSCPKEYTNCLEDVKQIARDQSILSNINNYVHPFNSFSHIATSFNPYGRVQIKIQKSYQEEDISMIQEKVDDIYEQLYDENKSIEDNIKVFHDYIINHAKYDTYRVEKGIVNYRSDLAYGPLFEGYAICGGYTDLMQLFLEKMGIKSYRISSEGHIWNAVYVNHQWLHIDLTWDDPVVDDGLDYLEHNYFLITTKKLKGLGDNHHNFSSDAYLEYKEK